MFSVFHGRNKKKLPMSLTLLELRAQAADAGQPLFVGTLLYALQQWSLKNMQYDAWNLTIVLGVSLAYLYIRSITTVIIIFSAFYFLEFAVFWLVGAFVQSVRKIEESHVRNLALLTDPLVAGLSLLVAYYIIDFTGIGSQYSVSDGQNFQSTGVSIAVLLVTLLTGVPQIYWISLILLLATIWIAYAASSGIDAGYTLWLASRATGFTLFYGLSFLRPLGETFLSNAFFSVTAATWFASAAQFFIERS
jgi:hypothetical protein